MTKHLGTKQITTERLILRKFVIGDAGDMHRNWANDAEVTKYLSWHPHGKIDVTREILTSWIEKYDDPAVYSWGIELKEIGQVIGSMAVMKFDCGDRTCEVGYCISKKYWNLGITSEALKAVLSFLIKDAGLERVAAFHHVDNVASGKVMQKAGMKFEGTLRKYHLGRDGELEDVDMYSMLNIDGL